MSELTPAEQRVWQAFPHGTVVDFRESEDEDAAGGETWGRERTVRGEVIRALLLGGAPQSDGVPGLWLRGARIAGQLDVSHGSVEHGIRLLGCLFEQPPILYGASMRQLDLSESHVPGLFGADVQVDGVMRLTGCRITGRTSLSAARISNSLFLDRTRVSGPIQLDGARIDNALVIEDAQLTEGTADSLRALNASIGGSVLGKNLLAHGRLLLTGLRVEASIDLEGAELLNSGGEALTAPGITVSLNMLCTSMRAQGEVRLTGSRIGGLLSFEGARLANPGGAALRLGGLTAAEVAATGVHAQGEVKMRAASITGALVLTDARMSHPGGTALLVDECSARQLWLTGADFTEGDISLRGGSFTTIHVGPEVWPAGVWLDGLNYQVLSPHLPPEDRLPLLTCDGGGFVPHSYGQLATAYQRIGDDDAARTVRLAQHRHRRSTLPGYARIWGHVQDATVGYGFRPMRAALWLLALLLVGSTVFGLRRPGPLKPDEAPEFNPVFYTLDLLLPIVDFGQEKAFQPEDGYQWLAHALVVLGWGLATTVVTGITRAISRQ